MFPYLNVGSVPPEKLHFGVFTRGSPKQLLIQDARAGLGKLLVSA